MKRGLTLIELLVTVAIGTIIFSLFWGIFGSNWWAKKVGGTIHQTIPAKVINITWKDNNLWILHRAPREGEKPEVLTFEERSNLGVIQGKVIITEQFEVEEESESTKELRETQAKELAKQKKNVKEFRELEKAKE